MDYKLTSEQAASYDRKGDISIHCDGVFYMSLFLVKEKLSVTFLVPISSGRPDRISVSRKLLGK